MLKFTLSFDAVNTVRPLATVGYLLNPLLNALVYAVYFRWQRCLETFHKVRKLWLNWTHRLLHRGKAETETGPSGNLQQQHQSCEMATLPVVRSRSSIRAPPNDNNNSSSHQIASPTSKF
jgi:hypothetical protein